MNQISYSKDKNKENIKYFSDGQRFGRQKYISMLLCFILNCI